MSYHYARYDTEKVADEFSARIAAKGFTVTDISPDGEAIEVVYRATKPTNPSNGEDL